VDLDNLSSSDAATPAHYGELKPESGPSIAELSARIQTPRGDTAAASRELFKIISQEGADASQ
jgi:hypothetical protein